MSLYVLTVSLSALGLPVVADNVVVIAKKRILVSDAFPPIINLYKVKSLTNVSGIATASLDPDDATVYHEVEIYDLLGVKIYTRVFTMPPQAVALTALPVPDIITVSAAEAVAAAETSTAQAVISTAQAVISTAQAGISTAQAGISTAQAVLTAADRIQTGLDVIATSANVVSTAADVATSLLNITTANNLLSAALVSASYATIALGLAGVATNAIFLVRPNSTDSLTRFTWYTKTGASTYTLLASAVTGAEFDATGIAGKILPLPIEVLPEGMRFRIANRLYADFNATTGFTFYKATLASGNTFLDDQPTVAIEDRVFGAALGTMFSALPDELGGVMRFRWGNRLLAEWDMTYGFKPSKMMIPSTAVLADSPTTPLVSRLAPSVDVTSIYAWGDSRTAGSGDVYPFRFPEYLSTLVSPVTVSTQAIGGQTSIMIAARHGGWPLMLSVTSDTIPASGAVAVTAYSTDIFNSSGTPLTAGSYVGTLAGIAGTYTSDGAGGLTFTRTTAGSATVIKKYSPFIPNNGSTNRNKINFICIGTNNAGTDSITGAVGSTYDNVRYCKAMVDYVLTGGGLPIVAGVIDNVPTGSANTVDCTALNNQYKSIFGRYYVDFFRPPTAEELATANTGVGSTYTFTANDNIDIAAGKWPRGLYADSVHFLRHGQYIQALRVQRHLIRLGIIT